MIDTYAAVTRGFDDSMISESGSSVASKMVLPKKPTMIAGEKTRISRPSTISSDHVFSCFRNFVLHNGRCYPCTL